MTAASSSEGIRDLALWVGLYRIALGIMWLQMALQKAPWILGPEGKPYGWLYGYIWKEINHPTFGFYTEFLEGVVLPNFYFFGLMTFALEIAIGLSLVLGLLVPLVGGLGGALMQANIMLGSYSIPGEWFWLWPMLIGSHIIFMMGRAGRRLGLDALLSRSLARAPRPDRKRRRWLAYVV
ncbi:MAG TPA: TQO small subunit DoxD [Candidatus Acidoferrales bacterium]|nr:TQO small subunit DoxD [Candidatus Acidoferrales bacterium]